MENLTTERNKEDILLRLRKIEGQIRGVQKMVEREAECSQILVQVAAAKSAMKRVGTLVIQNYLRSCVGSALDPREGQRNDKAIDKWIDIVSRFME